MTAPRRRRELLEALAEIVAATFLAGETSIIGALSASEFGRAHASYGRKPKSRPASRT